MINYKELLDRQITTELKELGNVTDQKEFDERVHYISVLIDKSIDLEEMEDKKKAEKKKTIIDILDKAIDHTINVAGIVLPLLVTIWGTKVTLEFEQEGNVTTIMGKGFFNKLLPKK
jgi:hypothetical protein